MIARLTCPAVALAKEDHFSLITDHVCLPAPQAMLVRRRTRRPAADTERSQHDLHSQRAKDESHDTDQHGRALSIDNPQNCIRVLEIVRKFSLSFWREGGDDFLETRVPTQ
jgi:hypothetical protein